MEHGFKGTVPLGLKSNVFDVVATGLSLRHGVREMGYF